jgi:hypothetical protein
MLDRIDQVPHMARFIPTYVVLLALAATASDMAGVHAADLALRPNTRLGAIFAAPAAPPPRVVETERDIDVVVPHLHTQPFTPGYYGGNYHYSSYYHTSPDIIFGRLPYACGLYGYC